MISYSSHTVYFARWQPAGGFWPQDDGSPGHRRSSGQARAVNAPLNFSSPKPLAGVFEEVAG